MTYAKHTSENGWLIPEYLSKSVHTKKLKTWSLTKKKLMFNPFQIENLHVRNHRWGRCDKLLRASEFEHPKSVSGKQRERRSTIKNNNGRNNGGCNSKVKAPIYACPKITKWTPVCFENVKHVWNLGQVLENFSQKSSSKIQS